MCASVETSKNYCPDLIIHVAFLVVVSSARERDMKKGRIANAPLIRGTGKGPHKEYTKLHAQSGAHCVGTVLCKKIPGFLMRPCPKLR